MTATFCDACRKKLGKVNAPNITAIIGVHGPFDLCADCADRIVTIIRNHEWKSDAMQEPDAA